MEKDDEIVLAIKRSELFSEGSFFGFIPTEVSKFDYYKRILEKREYKRRGDIEKDFSYKHPIPYVVVVNPETKKIFSYQRASKHHETRLGGKISIGVGGHVHDTDDKNDPLYATMLREIEEEVIIKGSQNAKLIGYINEDQTEVGKVHVGILFVIETDANEVLPNDPEIGNGELKDIYELEKIFSDPSVDIENWSRVIFNNIIEKYK